MNRRLAMLACAALAACAQAPVISTNYAGPDAGRVLLGFAVAGFGVESGLGRFTQPSYDYRFEFERLPAAPVAAPVAASAAQAQPVAGVFNLETPSLMGEPEYLSNVARGSVQAFSLAPGMYRLRNVRLVWGGGVGKPQVMDSPRPLDIRFRVEAGATTYLGNYLAYRLTKRGNVGLLDPDGAVFVVNDRFQTDVGIARRKQQLLGSPSNQTPDVAALAHPQFLTPQQNAARLGVAYEPEEVIVPGEGASTGQRSAGASAAAQAASAVQAPRSVRPANAAVR